MSGVRERMEGIIWEDVYLGPAVRGQRKPAICAAPYRATGY